MREGRRPEGSCGTVVLGSRLDVVGNEPMSPISVVFLSMLATPDPAASMSFVELVKEGRTSFLWLPDTLEDLLFRRPMLGSISVRGGMFGEDSPKGLRRLVAFTGKSSFKEMLMMEKGWLDEKCVLGEEIGRESCHHSWT